MFCVERSKGIGKGRYYSLELQAGCIRHRRYVFIAYIFFLYNLASPSFDLLSFSSNFGVSLLSVFCSVKGFLIYCCVTILLILGLFQEFLYSGLGAGSAFEDRSCVFFFPFFFFQFLFGSSVCLKLDAH